MKPNTHTGEPLKKEIPEFRVNTAALLKEALENGGPAVSIMKVPFNIFKSLLVLVGQRASELNDPVMNALMCRLAIYGESDQYSPDYNKEIVDKVLSNPEYKKWIKPKK